MSLHIYTKRNDVPENIQIEDDNDTFFNGTINNDSTTSKILKYIEQAEYANQTGFYGRDSDLGMINSQYLSTGCKTLLNVLYNPNRCFNLIECGQNALEVLPLIKEGYVLWEYPILFDRITDSCDISVKGKHFTNIVEALDSLRDLVDEKEIQEV